MKKMHFSSIILFVVVSTNIYFYYHINNKKYISKIKVIKPSWAHDLGHWFGRLIRVKPKHYCFNIKMISF